MTISVRCQCGALFQVRDEYAGKKGQCPTCGNLVVIPPKGAPTPPPDPSYPEPDPTFPGIVSDPAPVRTRHQTGWFTSPNQGFLGFTRQSGVVVLLFGMISVLVARGCDTTANRSVTRAYAKFELLQNEFNDEWEDKKLEVRKEIDDIEDSMTSSRKQIESIREKEDFDNDDADRIDKLQDKIEDYRDDLTEKEEDLREIEDDQARARREKLRGDWREYQTDLRDAVAENRATGWWRSWIFVIGTVILAFGLFAVAFTGEGAERTICMLMIAILTFSIYIGGIAWFDSIVNAVESANQRPSRMDFID